MKAVFADTFYWVALTNPADPYNREAAAKSRELAQTTIVTTDAVLTEFLTFFAEDAHQRNRAGETVRALLNSPDAKVIPESRSVFLSGLELYCARPDKGYSMTDCISMHIMRREGLTDVLTNDRHFEQEGFRALFRQAFRATGITVYLKNSGKLEVAQHIANHESPCTTKLYDRRQDEISLDEVERIAI